MDTKSGEFAVFIPFPFKDCAVQYQPKEDDATTREPVDWRVPALLPEKSALILLNGEIKFWPIIFKVDRKDISDEEIGERQ